MLAMRFERGNAALNYAVSFGTAPLHGKPCGIVNGWRGPACVGIGCGGATCNANGIAMYQL
jgi:hypothetical protein